MIYSVAFDSYNSRRYSRPWIARIASWPVGGRAELAWGNYLGNADGGRCEIECNHGDVIRWGQKDGRGNGGCSNYAVIVSPENTFVVDEPTAATYYRADAAMRANLIDNWTTIRAERAALKLEYEEALEVWRQAESEHKNALYLAATNIEKRIKALRYTA